MLRYFNYKFFKNKQNTERKFHLIEICFNSRKYLNSFFLLFFFVKQELCNIRYHLDSRINVLTSEEANNNRRVLFQTNHLLN